MSRRQTTLLDPIVVALVMGSILLNMNNTFIITQAIPDTTVEFVECSIEKWAAPDPYGRLMGGLVSDLLAYTDQQQGYVYYTSGTINDPRITSCYAFASCNTQLTPDDCYNCLDSAMENLIYNYCSYSIGAQVELTDCRMRYENYPF